MPVIQRDRTVIAWSGIQKGPTQEYTPMGAASDWVSYEAEVGDGSPEKAKVVVRVQKSWRAECGTIIGQEAKEAAERRIVEAYIEEYVSNARKQPLVTNSCNFFNISDTDMLKRAGCL